MSNPKSLPEVLALRREVGALLRVAEKAWPEAVEGAGILENSPEVAMIEDLLHGATHEYESALGFILQDIEGLLERVEIRRKYAIFENDEIDRIVAQGWSTTFVREIHGLHPSIPLAELSAQVKELCAEWGNLKKVSLSQQSPNPSIERTCPSKPGQDFYLKR